VNDWKPKKISFLFHLPPEPKTLPMVGSAMSSSFLRRDQKASIENGVVFVLRQQSSTEDGCALEHGLGLRDDFFPILAPGLAAFVTRTR